METTFSPAERHFLSSAITEFLIYDDKRIIPSDANLKEGDCVKNYESLCFEEENVDAPLSQNETTPC